ncbi:MAG: ABC transporter substrate-binding protein, partial [Chloroflexota bacterium]|nr:ABC transporter substrate-binding protein [Chloroflexota bacterium]
MTDRQPRDVGSPLQPRLTRRNLLRVGAGATGLLLLSACGGADPTPTTGAVTGSGQPTAPAGGGTGGTPQRGGVLKIAVIGEPPAVADAMFTTATITSNVAAQIFEGLFARDSKFAAKPMLVDRYTAAPDGKSYEFTLRRGVKFHNGKDLTSADVVASLRRWGQLTGRGKLIFGRLDGITAPDAATVTMTFKEPTGVLLDFLALTEAFILPADIADAAGKDKLAEDRLIGTGPFKFTEHQVDRFIRLTRYDGYAPRDDAPDGAAGKKVAYLDELRIIPVPDESVRVNGLLTGEYHFNETVPPDQYDTVRNDPNVNALIVKPYYWYCPHFNKKQGIFTDVRMRQAVALAFSQEEAMVAGFGRKDFIGLHPGIAAPETVWHSTAGQDLYNKPNPERARALLREAGYSGQTVRWLATKEYFYNFPMADLIKQKMEAIGMKVELVVSDWATLVQNRSKPEMYEIFLTGHSGYSHPATQPFNDKGWPGFWDNA